MTTLSSFFLRSAALGALSCSLACSGTSSTPGGPGGATGTGAAPGEDGGASGGTSSGGSGGSPSGGGGAGSTECWDGPLVSLTYDDALPTHLSIALPALEAHGLRGTFFVTDVSGSAPSWRKVRQDGHELGAHTFNHPCPASNSWVPEGQANEDYDLTRMATELDEQIAQLSSLGQTAPIPFAYPCGVTWVGEGQESYVGLVEERFGSARGVTPGVVTQANSLYNVSSYFLTGSGSSLIGVAEGAKSQNGWVVFGFHGVGGDHSAVAADAHEELLAFLESEVSAGTLRVLPFGVAAACLSAR